MLVASVSGPAPVSARGGVARVQAWLMVIGPNATGSTTVIPSIGAASWAIAPVANDRVAALIAAIKIVVIGT